MDKINNASLAVIKEDFEKKLVAVEQSKSHEISNQTKVLFIFKVSICKKKMIINKSRRAESKIRVEGARLE